MVAMHLRRQIQGFLQASGVQRNRAKWFEKPAWTEVWASDRRHCPRNFSSTNEFLSRSAPRNR